MSDSSSHPSDRCRHPLPDIQHAKISLSASSSVSPEAKSLRESSNPSPPVSSSSYPGFTTLLPAGLSPGYAASVSVPTRRQLTRIACETCRRQKTKCSGDRPRCVTCVRNRSECTYQSISSTETISQALKRRLREIEDENNILKELYQYLNTGPESQAHEIIRRIRMGADVGTIVREIQDGDLLLQISLIPEIKLKFELP